MNTPMAATQLGSIRRPFAAHHPTWVAIQTRLARSTFDLPLAVNTN
jgi:hypothetical protein